MIVSLALLSGPQTRAEQVAEQIQKLFHPRVRNPVVKRLGFAAERDQTVVPKASQVLGKRRLAELDSVAKGAN
jgi:hypothetical protein